VTETLEDWRIQLVIAAESRTAVATDILTLWSGEIKTQTHDSIGQKKLN
jgi:hypothetical protein